MAERHGLPLIEDAACALGSEVDLGDGWERIGRPRGDVACFSFHPRKILTTGDGGMLTTRHEEAHPRFRLERHHGVSVTDMARHTSSRVLLGEHVELGFNYRLTDIQAAVGRVQLTRLSEIVERRRELAGRYLELLADLPLELPVEPSWARTNWQSFWVRLPEPIDRQARHAAPARPRHRDAAGAVLAATGSPPTRPSPGGPEWAGWPRASAPRTGASCSRSTTTSVRSSRPGSSMPWAGRSTGLAGCGWEHMADRTAR